MKKMLHVFVLLAAAAWLAAPLAAAGPTPQDSLASPVQSVEAAIGPIGEQCGDVFCTKGTVCCNPTCNLCLPPDMSCTQEVCNGSETSQDSEPVLDLVVPAPEATLESEPMPLLQPVESAQPEQCGKRVCTPGTSCCNPLCSICTPPGVGCTLEDCGDG